LQQSFAKARAEVAATQQKMKELAAQFEKKPSNNLETALKRAADSAVRAKDAFTQQSRAIIESKNSLQSLGIPLSQVATEQARLKRGTLAATEALEQQGAKAQTLGARVRRGIGGVVGAIATVAGPAVLGATVKAVEAGMEVDSVDTSLKAAGISASDLKDVKASALHQKALWPGLSLSDLEERYKEEWSVTTSNDEAKKMFPIIAKAMAAMKDGTSTGMGLMLKVAQNLGATEDPARFTRMMDAFLRIKQIKGDLITPEDLLSFFRVLKGSGAQLSDRFLHSTAMSLSSEMRGKSGAGGLAEFIGAMVKPTRAQAIEFQKIGIMSGDNFERPTAHGSFKSFGHVRAGAVGKLKAGAHVTVRDEHGKDDSAIFKTDPDIAVEKYLLPALEQNGITELPAQLDWVHNNFSEAAAAVITNIITQAKEHRAEAEKMSVAHGFEGAVDNAEDATVQLKALRQEMWDFGAVMTGPMMLQAATTMHSISKSIAEWSEMLNAWQEKHPDAAPAAAGGGLAATLAAGLAATYYGLMKPALRMIGLMNPASSAVRIGAGVAPEVGAGSAFTLANMARGGSLAASVGALEYMKRDAATGNTGRTWLRNQLGIEDPNEPAPWQPGGEFHPGNGYRIASTGASSAPATFNERFGSFPIDNREAEAKAAGERLGAAFRQGAVPDVVGAVADVQAAINRIISMMTFGASPLITPAGAAGGDIWKSGTTGINANGIFSDSGVAPMR
jgi:hypothetical protein